MGKAVWPILQALVATYIYRCKIIKA
jgi:hypothetical protein